MRFLPSSFCWAKLFSQREEVSWKGGGKVCVGIILTCRTMVLLIIYVSPTHSHFFNHLPHDGDIYRPQKKCEMLKSVESIMVCRELP